MDSGADECVFPATSSDLLLPHTATLVAANGSDIKTFGKRDITLSFAPGVQMVHKFWIATVRRPILGADFFASHELLIDVSNKRLVGPSGQIFLATPTRHLCCFLLSFFPPRLGLALRDT